MVAADDLVVLLDEAYRPVGSAPKGSVHHRETPLHFAFSCYLFHPDTHEVLITRRSLEKPTWPGVWTNACCGHPKPDEDVVSAAQRRVREELGLTGSELRVVLPRFAYRATDSSGIVENELCPVLIGVADRDPTPDPAEVCAWSWTSWGDLRLVATRAPWAISPWAALQIPNLPDAVPELGEHSR
ncbi:MAG TPA: isopentenyl-diphosphate Delta-isomerase [Jiangellaceae bacterium]|nr:isopentenyl-diphosphate Delta-isomerase [Jiangellaceae bacterium]